MEGTPEPQPPPLQAPSYLGRNVGLGLEARSRASGARAPRSPERGGGGSGGFPSFLLLFLLRPRWLQTVLLPLAPCPPLPEPARLGSACDGKRSGAGGGPAAALTASSAGRERGGGGDSALGAEGRPGGRKSGSSGSGSGSGSGLGPTPPLPRGAERPLSAPHRTLQLPKPKGGALLSAGIWVVVERLHCLVHELQCRFCPFHGGSGGSGGEGSGASPEASPVTPPSRFLTVSATAAP